MTGSVPTLSSSGNNLDPPTFGDLGDLDTSAVTSRRRRLTMLLTCVVVIFIVVLTAIIVVVIVLGQLKVKGQNIKIICTLA